MTGDRIGSAHICGCSQWCKVLLQQHECMNIIYSLYKRIFMEFETAGEMTMLCKCTCTCNDTHKVYCADFFNINSLISYIICMCQTLGFDIGYGSLI